jgi:osmotically-inducible protein OsmY
MWRWVPWLALLAAGCKANDADLLARVCERAGQKLTPGPAGRLGGPFGQASLATRVHSRLRWDRALAGTAIHVRATAAGAVTLRGVVADAAGRRRALELARSTVGVEEVVDELTVAPAEEKEEEPQMNTDEHR